MRSSFERVCFLITGLALCAASVCAQVPDKANVIAGAERAVEKAAKSLTNPSPGGVVGVSLDGVAVFEKAFGMAEMEHRIPNTPRTIFESGSVAKQFVAASLVLLAQEGKLRLDDPVRKYIPELPDYGANLTIRHLLNHTAGLRDWGAVMALTGVGRGDRVISQDVAIDVIVRQKGLNFVPGAEYSYSNSGYQLATEIVERVSGQKLPEFTQERFFKPLGMMSSSWRDDYQRLVPNRAQAYARNSKGEWRLDMPFMNVYGNGGMLTTVGDWLKWNAMLDSRSPGAPLVEAMETRGVLNDGRTIEYALGLVVGEYKGIREISHGGVTAGYRTFLARYPDKKLSVAVMCNGAPQDPAGLAHRVVEEILGPFPKVAEPETVDLPETGLQQYVGLWGNPRTHVAESTVVDKGALRFGNKPLKATPDGSFRLGSPRVTFVPGPDGKPAFMDVESAGATERWVAEASWTPTAAEMAAIAGDWYSEEAQAKVTIAVENGKAAFVNKPLFRHELKPTFKDHFTAGDGNVAWVTRTPNGAVERLHVGSARMRDMPFERVQKSN